ncbi:L,D-peptidoglycan transpeptidase YkuD, ErfK/YbiS/YcfS/YnhG family [Enhydrobacter aerosaccus]|uniref:L,D-peptidoglycan transpeptidase YkuD, ErfK/YbiS/YcfS/YnhG family n=1 Tax=Enhydrobacter aerosaccus TaxID=225324 RepID=A0A1T4QPM8_9HYPH|nr:L,D-transpeptidase family protein [Enhydrobacter aerosaccus]SKA05421.1 L,D-peptidoglycan transpeptidase YkuD, ErfK/YbiS/YcfS/YnhG family [Enhydrobacter aerosaccus]
MSDADDLTQTLVVQADSADSALAWATLGSHRWRCVLGAGGVREDKVEGDAATPAGIFPLRRIYFRNDRLVLPKVRLPARAITEHDGWCDDPRAPSYNRLVRIPNEWSHEKMWREDGLYDLVVVVGYNDDPPEGEWGSAIFLHIARPDLSPTRGCVAFGRDDLLEIVPLISPETRLRVLSLPKAETALSPVNGDEDMKQFEDFDERDW